MPIKHEFVSAIADGPDDGRVRPSAWNEDHDLSELAATEMAYDNATSGILATTVQDALDEIVDTVGGGDLIGFHVWKPATQQNPTTTSTTIVDIDATNAAVSFTAPPGGAVLVYLEVSAYHSTGWMELGLRNGSTVLAAARVHAPSAGSGTAHRTFSVTGLVPGTTYTFKAGFSVGLGGTGTANIYVATDDPTVFSGGVGPLLMAVRNANPSEPHSSGIGRSVDRGLPTGILSRQYTFDSTVEGWTVDGGTLTAPSGKLRHVASASNQTALEPSGVLNIADGEVEMDVTLVSGGEYGVVFRATDASNYWMLVLRTAAGGATPSVQVYKKVAGTYSAFAATGTSSVTTEGGLISSAPVTVRTLLRFVGEHLAVYVDGAHVFSTALDSTNPSGRVGTRVGGSVTIDIDNVRVYDGVDLTSGNVVATIPTEPMFGSAVRRLDYTYAGADQTAVAISGWTDLAPAQNFAVGSASSEVECILSLMVQARSTTADRDINTRLLIDGVTAVSTGGWHYDNTNYYGIVGGAKYVNGLTAGNHTIKAQVWTTVAGDFYLRPAATSGAEHLHIQVIEHAAEAGTFVGARSYNSTTQTVTAATETTVLFDTDEYDTNNIHDTTTNTGRFAAPFKGKWRFVGHVSFAGTHGATYAYLRKNGGTAVTGSQASGASNGDDDLWCVAELDLDANDYIEMRAYRTSGTTFGATTGFASCSMSVSCLSAGILGDASDLVYDPVDSDLDSTNVQDAIDEIVGAGLDTILDYVETSTADTSITATSSATAETFITGNAVTYDGQTEVELHFFAPYAQPDTSAAGRQLIGCLYDGGTLVAQYIQMRTPATGLSLQSSLNGFYRFTPTAGPHTYSTRFYVTAGTGQVGAGGLYVPAFQKITRSVARGVRGPAGPANGVHVDTVMPTVTDDENDGYTIGTTWVIPGKHSWILVDDTAGAAVWQLLAPVIVRKPSDETVNTSATLQDDDHLLYPLAANEVVRFEADIWLFSGSTPDFKHAFTVPSGCDLKWSNTGFDDTDAHRDSFTVTTSGSSLTLAGSATPTRHSRVRGTAANGANPGNLQYQWAQNTSNASDTKVLTNSTLTVWRLA